MKTHVFLFWTSVLVEEESFAVEAMLTLVSTVPILHCTNECSEYYLFGSCISRVRD